MRDSIQPNRRHEQPVINPSSPCSEASILGEADMLNKIALGLVFLLALSACQDGQYAASTRHLAPIPPETLALMSTKGVSSAGPHPDAGLQEGV